MNIHGLRNKIKRKTLFHKLKRDHYDIVCLQETYITKNEVEQWEREWGGQLFYSSNTNHSMGQVVLLRRNFSFDTHCVVVSQRILTVVVKLEEDNLFIINAYGPNDRIERADFFQQLQTYIKKYSGNNLILCGDFNCVLDNDLDIISGGRHNEKDIELFQKTLNETSLNDLWRLIHGDIKEFTWSRKSPFIARRLDFICVSDEVLNKCSECEIQSVAQSDHRIVCMKYSISPITRGPSYWKFNDSLLHDQHFVNKMNDLICTYFAEFHELNAQHKWDLCKIKIKEFCIAYSKEKKTQLKVQFSTLTTNLDNTDKQLSRDPDNKELLTQRESLKHKLDLHELKQAKSAQVRSREKFIAEGEKNTRYFLNLETVRAKLKIMDQLKTEDGNTVTSQGDILQEQVAYYKNAFSKKNIFCELKAEEFIHDVDIPQLSQEQTDTLEKDLTEGDILAALKSMRNSSAPGLDGLTTSFIKFFWLNLKCMLIQSLQEAYLKGEMSDSQKRAVITLIHKGKDLPRDQLNNWRPISLTNTDYKLLAKCLAYRLSTVIGDLVNGDQVGFIKGRKSSTVIRLIDDVIDYMNDTNKPGILLALDYSRAFDSISKDYILWSFKKFGFGDNFINWVKVITAKTESCINYCGWISEEFPVDSGIRQGCPFSPMAFVLALELLAIKIRSDQSIQGILLPPVSSQIADQLHFIKLAMYADDITMFLNSKQDLEIALKLVNEFSEISQLKVNKNKTEAMWLGSMKKNQESHCGIRWKKQVKILGIIFQSDTPASNLQENWTKRLTKIEQIIAKWSKRNLSITGKVCIIKSFLISQFVYPMQALIAPTQILHKLNTILFRFMWKKKYSNTKAFEKVKRTNM